MYPLLDLILTLGAAAWVLRWMIPDLWRRARSPIDDAPQ